VRRRRSSNEIAQVERRNEARDAAIRGARARTHCAPVRDRLGRPGAVQRPSFGLRRIHEPSHRGVPRSRSGDTPGSVRLQRRRAPRSAHGEVPGGTSGIPNVHSETLTAANGDELVLRMVNVGCPTGPFTFHGTGHWTVVGGTGRFQGVTGQGTNEGDADFETNTFALTMTGTLSFR
jgi:hypothetical protein